MAAKPQNPSPVLPVQRWPGRSADTKPDAKPDAESDAEPGLEKRGGSESIGPPPDAALSRTPTPASGAGFEGNDARTLEGVALPPGVADFLLPDPMTSLGRGGGLLPLKLADLLRQSPLSQSAVASGRMEMVFAYGPEGNVRARFWRLKAGMDGGGHSSEGGRRASQTPVSEQARRQRRKDWQEHARESLKRIKGTMIDGTMIDGALIDGALIDGVAIIGPFALSSAPILTGEASAQRAVTEYAGWVAAQAREAEAAFWAECSGVRVPPNADFEPWIDTKSFTAADCLRYTLEAAGRRWFQAACEKRELARAMGGRGERENGWTETLARVNRIRQRFLWAKFAWSEYALLSKKSRHKEQTHKERITGADSAAAATEWLAAWIEATIGGVHLRPLMARSSPGTGPERLRHELLLEVWGGVLALNADTLPVPAFCGLPAAVARGVRALHSDSSDHFGRLTPETQNRVLSLNASIPDPQATLLGKEKVALLWERLYSLPPQQRHALELAAAGVPRREMAAAMGCGEESAKEHLTRARRRLRAELEGLEA